MDSLIDHEGIHFTLLYLALILSFNTDLLGLIALILGLTALILIYLALILLYIVLYLEERSECFGEKNKVTD